MSTRSSTQTREYEQWVGTLPSGQSRFVTASFKKLDHAVDAARNLEERGFERDRVSVFMAEETRDSLIDTHPRYSELEENAVVVDDVELEKQSKTLEGAGAGGTIGGALGAAGAAIAAVGTTLVVPVLGIAVAGPLAAMLAGAGAGAAAGGLVGALVGAGMTEYRARHFEELIKDGNIMVGAAAETEAEWSLIVQVLEENHGDIVRAEEEEPAE